MKRSKRAQANEDSLDLLMDTMSNSFGGIMFIAITLIVLLVGRDVTRHKLDNAESAVALNIEAAVVDNADLEKKITALEKELTQLSLSPEVAAKERLVIENQRMALQLDLLQSRNKLAENQEKLLKLESENLRKLGQKLQKELVQTQAQLVESRTQYAEQRRQSDKVEQILPYLRRTVATLQPQLQRKPLFVIVKNGELFILQKPDVQIVADNKINPEGVSSMVEVKLESDGQVMKYAPRTGQGVNLNLGAAAALEKLTRGFDMNNYFFDFEVHDNSISEFIPIQRYLSDQAQSYNWMPYAQESELILFTTNEARYNSYE
ncbi:MAG: hypothetical protein RR060_02890 [Victivallaceae bacterium]